MDSTYKMSGSVNIGPIPSRWLNCPRKAMKLIANKFLAFKTPLSSLYNNQVPEECRFNVDMLFQYLKSQKMKLGLWIDLTNTSRFYDRKSVEVHCKYVKVQCRGHNETPSVEQVQKFIQSCKTFISHKPTEFIGIHCTHGFNRTGFLLVSYLVEEHGVSVVTALTEFSIARPPGIYKADYIQELYKRYDNVQNSPAPPPRPSWCLECDNLNDDEEEDSTARPPAQYKNDNGQRNVTNQRNKSKAIFMAGIPGVIAVSDGTKISNIQSHIQDICNWKSSGFPGSQPVSMDQSNIKLLHTKPYRVSWKADGTRYMMLVQDKDVYFIDRNNCVFQVNGLSFPHVRETARYLKDTLMDGEMVIDKDKDKNIPRYLVYDVIMYDKQDVSKLPFHPERYFIIEHKIIGGRVKAIQEGRIVKEREPFSVRIKYFWDVTLSQNLLSEKFANQLTHEPDGLIFQPSKEKYCTGTSLEVLKWKPPTLNSVDFRLKIVTESGPGILPHKIGHLMVTGTKIPFATIKLTKELKTLDNAIIECVFKNSTWVFMRQRTDKSFPNSHNTAQSICKSIFQPVTKEALLSFIENYRFTEEKEDDEEPTSPEPKRQRVR